MINPLDYSTLYHMIESRAARNAFIQDVLLGLSWSSVRIADPATAEQSCGLSFSPASAPRNLPWPGSLSGRATADILPWLHHFESAEVAVALATANAIINRDSPVLAQSTVIDAHKTQNIAPNLAVFAHFAPQLAGKNVAIIGRYPGLDRFREQFSFRVIERNPQGDDLPDAAANYVLPESDWVFITASALVNKTLPHLLWLSRNAQVVLMGPSMPWLAEWAEYGVHHLAGVQVDDYDRLTRIIAEGGGTAIFDSAVSYRVAEL